MTCDWCGDGPRDCALPTGDIICQECFDSHHVVWKDGHPVVRPVDGEA